MGVYNEKYSHSQPGDTRIRTYNLCIVGFGNVGRAFVALLQRKETGTPRTATAWLGGLPGWLRAGWAGWWRRMASAVEKLLAGDFSRRAGRWRRSRVAAAGRADALFEVSSLNAATGQPAIAHIRAALEAGAHAISANKGPVVHAYRELTDLAAAKGRRFLFESAVMDGVPIFSLFRETLPAVEVRGFRGVLNSTTNVILEGMEAGMTFDESVRQAQRLGVAESDPTDDIEGVDAAVKVVALANVLMHADLKLDDVQPARYPRNHRGAVARSARQRRSLEVGLQCQARDGWARGGVSCAAAAQAFRSAGTGERHVVGHQF